MQNTTAVQPHTNRPAKQHLYRQVAWQDATDQIKRQVSVPYALRHIVRWRIRGRKRSDCGLCKAGGIGPVSIDERKWFCHHCHEGGDVIRLIELAHGVKFTDALRYLSEVAHVELPTTKKMSPAERERLAREQAQRERVGSSAAKLDSAEQNLLVWYCAMIQRCERKQDEVRRRMAELHRGAVERWGGEYEGCWGWLAVLVPLLRSYLAGYTLLAFGCAQDRARFVLRPALRQGMIDCALLEDFVDDAGKRQEVLE